MNASETLRCFLRNSPSRAQARAGVVFAKHAAITVFACLLVQAAPAEDVEAVRILSDNALSIDGERKVLAGAVVPTSVRQCGSGDEAWPCGASATLRLYAMLKALPIRCDSNETDSEEQFVTCGNAEHGDISRQLVMEGWAVAPDANDAYMREEAYARDSGAGIWRGGFAPPAHWRAYPTGQINPIDDLLCSECSARRQ